MKAFYFTFGSSHAFGSDWCLRIIAPNMNEAREEMHRRFGERWSMAYNTSFEAGVEEYQLSVITLNPWNAEKWEDDKVIEEKKPEELAKMTLWQIFKHLEQFVGNEALQKNVFKQWHKGVYLNAAETSISQISDPEERMKAREMHERIAETSADYEVDRME